MTKKMPLVGIKPDKSDEALKLRNECLNNTKAQEDAAEGIQVSLIQHIFDNYRMYEERFQRGATMEVSISFNGQQRKTNLPDCSEYWKMHISTHTNPKSGEQSFLTSELSALPFYTEISKVFWKMLCQVYFRLSIA